MDGGPRGDLGKAYGDAVSSLASAPPLTSARGLLPPEVRRALLEAADRARLPWQFDFRPAQRELEGLVVPPEA